MDFYNGIGISPLIDFMDGADVDNWMLDGSQDFSLWSQLIIEENKWKEQFDAQSIIPTSSSESTGLDLAKTKQTKDICESLYQQLSDNEGKTLSQLIKQEYFNEEDLLNAFSVFDAILNTYPYISSAWIIDIYKDIFANDVYLARLLTIIAEFANKEDVEGVSLLLAEAELNNCSYEIADLAMNVFECLPKDLAKKALNHLSEPKDVLLQLKYETILSKIE